MEKGKGRLLMLDVDSYAEATMSLSPAIARACEEGRVPETLAMFTHRKSSIVMGRQNDPEVDLNFQYCRSKGIIVKRVPTPGTIFGHPEYVMNALYLRRDRVPEAIPEVFALINRQFALVYARRWGIEARHRPINDLEVQVRGQWKKVGPFSISFFGPCICCRMGLTVRPIPFEEVEKAVPGPPEKFADKADKSVTTRVGALEEALGRRIEIAEVQAVVREALSELFPIDFQPGTLEEVEKDYERELRERYDNDEWFWANSVRNRFPRIPEGATLHEHTEKVPQGPLIRARVLKKGGEVLDCSFTGWYHGVRPLDALERVESILKGIPYDPNAMENRIEGIFRQESIEIDQCRPADFVRILSAAVEKEPVQYFPVK